MHSLNTTLFLVTRKYILKNMFIPVRMDNSYNKLLTRTFLEGSSLLSYKKNTANTENKCDAYCETQKTVNTRNINGMLLCCKEKANQA